MLKIIKKTDVFTGYIPEKRIHGVRYLKGAIDNKDWYECQNEFKKNTAKLQISNDGLVVSEHKDISAFFPLNCFVVEVEGLHDKAVGLYLQDNKLVKYKTRDDEFKKVIDAVAHAAYLARDSLTQEDKSISLEYDFIYTEAKQYIKALEKDNGVTVPPSIATHAEIYNVSPEEAAKAIVEKANQWFLFLEKVRDIRLKAKAAVRQAANSHPEIELIATAQPFIEKLNQLAAENKNDHP